MDKSVLIQYSDAKARIKLLYRSRDRKQKALDKLNKSGYYVTDFVTRGRRGKKSLGTVTIAGFPYPERDRIAKEIEKQDARMRMEEQELLELQTRAEEYIAGIKNIRMRNIMTLYYIEDMNWVQVAHTMNELYPKDRKPFSESSCRQRHDRFLEKN